jgi:hypothetical protein
MGYARAGFGAGSVAALLKQVTLAKPVLAPVVPVVPVAPSQPLTVTTGVTTQGPGSGVIPAQPIQPMPFQPIQPVLVGPTLPSGGGSGGADVFGSAPTGGGSLLTQPAVLIGLAVLGFLALRRARGTRRF